MTFYERARAFLPWKLAAAGLYTVNFLLYRAIQQHATDATVIPWTPIDLLVPVLPALLPVYVAQLLLETLPFLFIGSFAQWRRAVMGLSIVSAIGMLIFVVFPTCIQAWPHPAGSALAWVNTVDGRGNACPSLHAMCAIYVAILCHGFAEAPRWLLVGVWLWTATVLFACVALRQHTIIDLLAGGGMGAVAAVLSGVHRLEGRP